MNTKGRSLELYFIDGKADGMVTASVPPVRTYLQSYPQIN